SLQGRRISILTLQGRGERELALLDQFDAAVGLGGETRYLLRIIVGLRDGGGCGRRGRNEARGGIAGPGDKAEENDEEKCLDGGGNAEAAQLRTIVNEKVPVAE